MGKIFAVNQNGQWKVNYRTHEDLSFWERLKALFAPQPFVALMEHAALHDELAAERVAHQAAVGSLRMLEEQIAQSKNLVEAVGDRVAVKVNFPVDLWKRVEAQADATQTPLEKLICDAVADNLEFGSSSPLTLRFTRWKWLDEKPATAEPQRKEKPKSAKPRARTAKGTFKPKPKPGKRKSSKKAPAKM